MGGLRHAAALALMAAGLAACATVPRPSRPGQPPPRSRPPAAPAPAKPPPIRLSSLPGWSAEDHAAAFAAYQAGCGAARDPASVRTCRRARSAGPLAEPAARAFFEDNFRPVALDGDGLLTAYFQPEYEARLQPGGDFTAPVRALPPTKASPPPAAPPAHPPPYSADPLADQLGALLAEASPGLDPSADRAAIEAAPVGDAALAWMRPEDLFFMQIQGSGVLILDDGRRLRAAFAASNGKPFVGLARLMREDGILSDKDSSQEAIHAWLAAHRGPDADALMRRNPRYVFFTVGPDDAAQPAGAAGLALTPGRALAVDAARHAMGELYWIDASAPVLSGAFPAYRRLAMALDIGGAIKGEVRADLYLGRGDAAGREAGRVRHRLRMYRLEPRP